MSAKQFLIIHLFSNGDCLYATTFARQLKQDFPGCFITWIISEGCQAILRGNPFIDKVETVQVKDKAETDKIIEQLVDEANRQIKKGALDEYFVTQITGDNYARYDGSVRSSMYRNFPYKITVDTTPVLALSSEEINTAESFYTRHELIKYKNKILFECAPLSGQTIFSDAFILEVAEKISADGQTCVILSSARKIGSSSSHVFDGSVLTIRETAALSAHCTLLVGASSGITWACTAFPENNLHMVQLLDADAYIFNPPSIDFIKRGKGTNLLLELYRFDEKLLIQCLSTIFVEGFGSARNKFNQPPPLHFRIFRGIVHHFLLNGKFKLAWRFAMLNIRVHHAHPRMLWMLAKGFFLFPLQVLVDKHK